MIYAAHIRINGSYQPRIPSPLEAMAASVLHLDIVVDSGFVMNEFTSRLEAISEDMYCKMKKKWQRVKALEAGRATVGDDEESL